jgi:predicted dehydrogenase
MIGFVRRHGRDAKTLIDFVKGGFFGDMYYAKATYVRRNGAPGGWFGDKSRSGGGPVIDLGVHVIDLCKYIMGNHKPVSVYAATFDKIGDRRHLEESKAWVSTGRAKNDIFDVEDFATALIRFDNGAIISLETSFSLNTAEPRAEIEIYGDKGGAKLGDEVTMASDLCGHLVDLSFPSNKNFVFEESFDAEIKNFVDAVLGRAECLAPAADGVSLMDIIDAIYKSAATGSEVKI